MSANEPVNEAMRRSVEVMVAAYRALPTEGALLREVECMDGASARGYFFPDEEAWIRFRYVQYLALRAAILETHAELESMVRGGPKRHPLPVFAVAFLATCILDRADRYLVELATTRPVVWKKLDEQDAQAGIPRKTFTRIYRERTHPRTATRLVMALDFYRRQRAAILALKDDPAVGPVIGLLLEEEPWMELRLGEALKHRAKYRWFSFLRRHRSAWKKVTFGIFEASGRAVAELRVPGVKPRGAPKRISAEHRRDLLPRLRPGDVLVTRHDDALSNLFLPGYWPHAALYLGTGEDLGSWGAAASAAGHWFLEAKKDGVRVRAAEETLQVDALVVLRPTLDDGQLAQALERALGHVGKPYDFLFDFRTADRLVCTEVIYRGFHGVGPVKFELREVGGRLCLPAEEFLAQAVACGFEVVATAGVAGDVVLTGTPAQQAFAGTQAALRPDA